MQSSPTTLLSRRCDSFAENCGPPYAGYDCVVGACEIAAQAQYITRGSVHHGHHQDP